MNINVAVLREIPYTLGFFIKTLKSTGFFMVRGHIQFKIFIMQILFTFVEALGIISLLALGIGVAVNAIGMPFLAIISQERYIYPLLIAIIMRELGPLLTAFIVIARSATAIATEVAGMVVSHEVEAYISVGVDPIEHLAVPRFLGVTVSLFFLNIYFSLFGLGASFAVVQIFNPLPPGVYFDNLLRSLNFSDIIISVVKSISFGMIIAIVAIIRGFSVERASTEIPVAGLKAVGASFAWCILLDILLSALYYTALN
ncbi:MAG: ABC transporter permease [Treponema sp.]|jgi:phospholipid/cholesterol/gamma-HCH transport system permease protein|nr:ABC transporter permease [Treponema sp.]